MKLVECELQSTTPYSQSKFYNVEKLSEELPAAYEERTWRERCHVNSDGLVFMPPMAFSNNIKEAAKYASIAIPGKGSSKYTKNFEAGILVVDPIVLPIKKDDVQHEWVFVPSNGIRGGGKRVMKCFPLIPEWRGNVTYHIIDDIITQDVFEKVLDVGGNLIGLGRFRPSNMGYYGRFKVLKVTWVDG